MRTETRPDSVYKTRLQGGGDPVRLSRRRYGGERMKADDSPKMSQVSDTRSRTSLMKV